MYLFIISIAQNNHVAQETPHLHMMLVICLTLTRLGDTKNPSPGLEEILVYWVYFLLVLDLLRYATFQHVEISNICMVFQSLVYLLFINLIKIK